MFKTAALWGRLDLYLEIIRQIFYFLTLSGEAVTPQEETEQGPLSLTAST